MASNMALRAPGGRGKLSYWLNGAERAGGGGCWNGVGASKLVAWSSTTDAASNRLPQRGQRRTQPRARIPRNNVQPNQRDGICRVSSTGSFERSAYGLNEATGPTPSP